MCVFVLISSCAFRNLWPTNRPVTPIGPPTPMPEKLKFTVDSALLSELGEKLVETPHIALVELVKNAYDADATETIIKIIPNPELNVAFTQDGKGTPTIVAKPSGPQIHIIDNGSGMTFEDVENYWMRIATT